MTEKSDSNLLNANTEDVMDLFDNGKPDLVDHQRAALIAACKEAEANREKAAAIVGMQSCKPINLERLT